MKKIGLYIHIPFCIKKCNYCDFCSFSGNGGEKMSEYVSALCRDIERYTEFCRGYSVDTIYFGGGTPTLLPICDFERLIKKIREGFEIDADCEISTECNPATADLEYLRSLRDLGINRLSIGLQSVHENELRALGRVHSYEDFKKTYADARKAGFENISADLMYGIPEQTIESFSSSLCALVSLCPEHISAYGLKIEDGTAFGRMRESLVLPDEDTEYEMYMKLTDYLEKCGYNKYEISNFSHKGYESKHNMRYWRGEEYLGFGVSAHSYFGGFRFSNSRDIDAYILGEDITEEKREIVEKERMTEYVMLRMRLCEGLKYRDFESLFGARFEELYGERIAEFANTGYILCDAESCRFSSKGFFVSNYILSDILDF